MKRILTFVILVGTMFARPAKTAKIFPATHESVAAENERADSLGLKRYETRSEVLQDEARSILVPFRVPVSSKIPRWRRYALPETVDFAEKLDVDFYEATGNHLIVDSAIRPRDVQQWLRRRNRNAAPAQGARSSSHERGTTFDISSRMKREQYRWLRTRLAYYRALGEILVIEERSCLHIFVGRNHEGPFEIVSKPGRESVDATLAFRPALAVFV